MQRYCKSLLLMGTCCLLFLIAGCNESEIKSIWRQPNQNNITSILDDFRPMIYYEDQKIGVGFQNDADNLYIMLKTSDRGMQEKVMRAGLTIWLDSKGKKNKTLGVHFPLGMQAFRNSMQGERFPEEGSEEPRRHFGGRMDTLEILGPSKDEQHKIPRENDLGIVASFSDTTGWMDYELTIPG